MGPNQAAATCFVVLAMAAFSWGAKITILNDVPAHFEVLAGVLHVVRRHVDPHPQIVWLTRGIGNVGNTMPKHFYGLVDWLGDSAPGSTTQLDWHNWDTKKQNSTLTLRQTLSWGPVDMVVCISPELEATHMCHTVAELLGARLTLALAHRADQIKPNWRFLDKPPVPLHFLTLAPHVHVHLTAKLDVPVSWALPVAPFTHPQPCVSRSCLSGFAVQGTVRRWKMKGGTGLIRDFDGLWRQMLLPHAVSINVTVLGRGNRTHLNIPPALEPRVKFYSKLPYPEFWSAIADSLALVPAFGHPQYLTSRISSTVVASLTTCTPMIVSRSMLYVYSFLREEHVFLQHDNETDVDTMLRVEAMGEQELFAKRRALCELRDRLNTRAAQLLVDLAEGRAGDGEYSGGSAVGEGRGGGGGAGGGVGLVRVEAGGAGAGGGGDGAGTGGYNARDKTYGELIRSIGTAGGSSSGGKGRPELDFSPMHILVEAEAARLAAVLKAGALVGHGARQPMSLWKRQRQEEQRGQELQ